MMQDRFKDLNIVYMTEKKYWWDALHPIYELTGGTLVAQSGILLDYLGLDWNRSKLKKYNIKSIADEFKADAVVIDGYIPFSKNPPELINSAGVPLINYVHSPAHRTGSNTSDRYNLSNLGLVTSAPRKEDLIQDGVVTPMDVVGWTKAQYFRNLPDKSDEATVLYMASNSGWVKGTFNHSGLELVERLVEEGYNVLVQPHPLDVRAKPFKPVIEKMKALPNVELIDDEHVGPERLQDLYSRATYYVGDYTGSQLEFALTGKPVFNLFDTKIERRPTKKVRKGSFKYHSSIGHPCDTVEDVINAINNYTPGIDEPFNQEELDKYIPNLGNEAELAADAIYNAIINYKSKY